MEKAKLNTERERERKSLREKKIIKLRLMANISKKKKKTNKYIFHQIPLIAKIFAKNKGINIQSTLDKENLYISHFFFFIFQMAIAK